jgi:hypothetical protein
LPITMGARTQRCHGRRHALASQRDRAERTQKNVDHDTDAMDAFPGEVGERGPMSASRPLPYPRGFRKRLPEMEIASRFISFFLASTLDFHADCELIL